MQEERILYEGTAAKGDVLTLHHDTLLGWGATADQFRWLRITLGAKYAQWERHIWISKLKPRQRKSREIWLLYPDGGAWYWVTLNGKTVWDSRTVFPVWASVEEDRANSQRRHGYGPGPENDAAVARYDAQLVELFKTHPDMAKCHPHLAT